MIKAYVGVHSYKKSSEDMQVSQSQISHAIHDKTPDKRILHFFGLKKIDRDTYESDLEDIL